MRELHLKWGDEELILNSQKVVFLPERGALLLSDLHLGKAAHFRKNGIAIPEGVHVDDLFNLHQLIMYYQPKEVFILGDLFHSEWNSSWIDFQNFILTFSDIRFHIVIGNHDILSEQWYKQSLLSIHKPSFTLGGLLLSHDHVQDSQGLKNIYGHIHPGVSIPLKSRQKISAPCFFLGDNQLILPSFGKFTGIALLDKTFKGKFFAILDGGLIEVTSLVKQTK